MTKDHKNAIAFYIIGLITGICTIQAIYTHANSLLDCIIYLVLGFLVTFSASWLFLKLITDIDK